MHSEIYCLWVHFYIDRSRKVPPTFFLGEPLAFRYYIKNLIRSVKHYEKNLECITYLYAYYGRNRDSGEVTNAGSLGK